MAVCSSQLSGKRITTIAFAFSFRERMSQAVWSSKNLLQITAQACQGMWAKGGRDAVARTVEMRIFFSGLIRAETFELYFCNFRCLQSIRP